MKIMRLSMAVMVFFSIASPNYAQDACTWSYVEASFGGEDYCIREDGMDRRFADDGETTVFIRYNPRHLGVMPFEMPQGILEIEFIDGAMRPADPERQRGNFGDTDVRSFVPSELRFRGEPFHLSCRESLQHEYAAIGGQTCRMQAQVTPTSYVVFSIQTIYGRLMGPSREPIDVKSVARVEEGFERRWVTYVRGLEDTVAVLLYHPD